MIGWFESRQGLGIFLFITASRPALGTTQPPIQWVTGAISLGLKRSGHQADHSPPSSAVFNYGWNYTFTPPPPPNTASWRVSQLKHRDNFLPLLVLKASGQLENPTAFIPWEGSVGTFCVAWGLGEPQSWSGRGERESPRPWHESNPARLARNKSLYWAKPLNTVRLY
jgi:hypothetical protein